MKVDMYLLMRQGKSSTSLKKITIFQMSFKSVNSTKSQKNKYVRVKIQNFGNINKDVEIYKRSVQIKNIKNLESKNLKIPNMK